MKSNKLQVDGPFVVGQLAVPKGILDSPVSIEIFLDDAKSGIALVDKVAGRAAPGRAARLSSFEFRIPNLVPERHSPVICARESSGAMFGSVAWNAASRRMARWVGDVQSVFAKAGPAEDIVSLADDFRRFAKWHPVIVLRNKRATASIVRDLAIALSATGYCGKAAQLLAAFPLFASLRSRDAALFETLRIIADAADWRDKRRLATVLAISGLRSDTAGAFARRMRLSRSGYAGQADAAWLRRVMDDASATPVLRAFAAETLALHTQEPLAGPQ